MVSSITQDPYSIIISLNLASSVNLNIGAPPRPTELLARVLYRPHPYASVWKLNGRMVFLLPPGRGRGLTDNTPGKWGRGEDHDAHVIVSIDSRSDSGIHFRVRRCRLLRYGYMCCFNMCVGNEQPIVLCCAACIDASSYRILFRSERVLIKFRNID